MRGKIKFEISSARMISTLPLENDFSPRKRLSLCAIAAAGAV